MVIWKIGVFFRLKWLKMARKMGLGCTGSVFYIGGAETLPPPLSAEEENYLMKHFDDAGMDVRSILIEHNLRLVVYIAKKFENTNVNVEDLISIGTIGLIKSINTFAPNKNIKLATYASRCIENEILMYLRKSTRQKTEVSIDEPLKADWDGNELLLSDVLSSDEDIVSRDIEDESEMEMLHAALNKLSPRERKIMDLRFGFSDGEEMTQKEVADMLGISQSYISRLEKRIIGRLRKELVKSGI
ncbi:MAG: RNA polymerase sporulation sigma factor SigE [Clostridia bacterium]|nr:RNA polymerase sporulation sigma factor SigE [Clostridia bacterium]